MNSTARIWQLPRFGRSNLQLVERPIPTPGAREVLVRVEAVALNYRDHLLVENHYGWTPPLPYTPASDLAGTVIATGEGVTRWRGDEKVISTFFAGWLDGRMPATANPLGGPGPGVLASHVVLHEDWLAAAPAGYTAAQAATLPCAGLTAWTALVEEGALHAGQTVLIHGTGGVALFGLQLARLHGAKVIVISGSADKRDKTLALGAAHVIARDGDWQAEVLRLTDGQGVDHVLETVGGANLGRSLKTLAQGGRIAVIGVLEGIELTAAFPDLVRTHGHIQGIGVGSRAQLETFTRAAQANKLQPVIAGEYAFEDAPAALEHLARGPFGKVVVRV
ncbi:NAD(P)-dependent alcohol dehydrogenase [Uliginosibacterium sp. H3]|uniref:NAD(P)-dependent alcohol dehydrogenase n=1 Tax=Uliginosibacterium silvisoli TaxID=3114758 RepID=A0ABU6K0X5_9RHOO|nr:NAD(P)-dependent alcohol dehydrogenase [Uliginosibacterium sp. H3]